MTRASVRLVMAAAAIACGAVGVAAAMVSVRAVADREDIAGRAVGCAALIDGMVVSASNGAATWVRAGMFARGHHGANPSNAGDEQQGDYVGHLHAPALSEAVSRRSGRVAGRFQLRAAAA